MEQITDGMVQVMHAESAFYSRIICTRDYKYIMEYRPNDGEDTMPPCGDTHHVGCEHLFNLAADPGETVNLADTNGYREILI